MKTKQPKQKELPIEKLTINRKRWLRGQKDSVLRNEEGLMCCLGFYCLLKKFKISDIFNRSAPEEVLKRTRVDVINKTTKLGRLLIDNDNEEGKIINNNEVCNDLMICNDNTDISDKQRERRITQLFKKINVEVKFVN